MSAAQIEQSPYLKAFRGSFTSTLQWDDLDKFWQALRQRRDAGWYIYLIGEAPPAAPVTAEQLDTFIDEVDALLRKEHTESYCGIVYADNLETPSFIKIYDPNNLGVTCGYSTNPPLPGWVLSLIPPDELKSMAILTGSRKRWWHKLFGK